ncbi:MAG: hypothetical protein HGA44_19480, partial [Cellulomonadaceae bacterium]|nr:hypothetical protein [Cellulomonadaceae bacterium]
DTADGAEAGTVVVAFRADERRCRVLLRSLERLAVVRAVEVQVAGARPPREASLRLRPGRGPLLS